ncbi:MAG: hypothetical protein WCB85_01400 [Candidatus Dormiibacterota bacterium]
MDDTTRTTRARGDRSVAAHGGSGLWFMGFIGALVYYVQHDSGSAGLVILGILKALVWPALLIYYLLLVGKA